MYNRCFTNLIMPSLLVIHQTFIEYRLTLFYMTFLLVIAIRQFCRDEKCYCNWLDEKINLHYHHKNITNISRVDLISGLINRIHKILLFLNVSKKCKPFLCKNFQLRKLICGLLFVQCFFNKGNFKNWLAWENPALY